MSVELEVTVKIRMNDGTPPTPQAVPWLARLLGRLTAHPCVVMLLREILGK